jgi:hypothetical protein
MKISLFCVNYDQNKKLQNKMQYYAVFRKNSFKIMTQIEVFFFNFK